MPATPPALDPAAIDFSATGLVSVFLRHRLGAAAARRRPPSATSSRSPTRRCRRRAGPATAARSAATSRPATSWRSSPAPETTPAQRAGFLDVYEQTMRRTDAAEHYFFGAAYFDRVLEADRTWLALATAPDGDARRRLDRRRQRRLPPLLPLRQRRLPPARLADEERRRPPGRARRRARPAAQPRRRHRRRRRPRGVQARLRQPRGALAHLGARLRPGRLRAPRRRPRGPAAFFPAYRARSGPGARSRTRGFRGRF